MDGLRIKRWGVTAVLGLILTWLPTHPASAQSMEELAADIALLQDEVQNLHQDQENEVSLHGYFSLEYYEDTQAGNPSRFRQHSMNLFVRRDWERARIFGELKFEDGVELEGDGTTVDGKGAVKAEFVWYEYRAHDALTLRAGKFLTPQYWNVNHYPPSVLSTSRPLLVKNVFPGDQIGLMVYGNLAPPINVVYHVYVTNGRTDSTTDNNQNKAVGGHLSFLLNDVINRSGIVGRIKRLHVGVSAFSDNNPLDEGAYDVVGADLQFNTGRYELLFEYARAHGDSPREAFYVQPSTRLVGQLRAFFRWDYLDRASSRDHEQQVLGLNCRPVPNVSLKLETISHHEAVDYEEYISSIAVFF